MFSLAVLIRIENGLFVNDRDIIKCAQELQQNINPFKNVKLHYIFSYMGIYCYNKA